MLVGKVYIHTCNINNLVYIGQTWQDVVVRWKQHIYDALHGSQIPFHLAIDEHSPKSFSSDVLASSHTQSELDFLETLFIAAMRATDSNFGYNQKDGGSNGIPNGYTRGKISNALREKGEHLKELRKGVYNPYALSADFDIHNLSPGSRKHFGHWNYERVSKRRKHRKDILESEKCKNCGKVIWLDGTPIKINVEFCSPQCQELFSKQLIIFNDILSRCSKDNQLS